MARASVSARAAAPYGELVNQYIDMGGLYQLDDLLAQYAPNLTAFLGEELLGYGQKDMDGDGVKEQCCGSLRKPLEL